MERTRTQQTVYGRIPVKSATGIVTKIYSTVHYIFSNGNGSGVVRVKL